MKNFTTRFLVILSTLIFPLSSSAQCSTSLELDGVDDFLYTPFHNYNFSNFTFEIWLKVPNYTTNVHYISLYQNSYLVLGDYGSGNIDTWADGLSPIQVSTVATPAANTWAHFAFVYDGTNQIIYINGVAAITSPTTGGVSASATYAQGLTIGARYSHDTQFIAGEIRDLRIWEVARSATQITNAMNTHLNGTEMGLVAYYDFSDGTGSSTVTDLTGNGNDLTLNNMDPSTDWQITGTTAPGTDTQVACNSYTWIDGNIYTASNNTATYIIPGSMGCDSLVTLNLTIDSVSSTDVILSSGVILTATNVNATYQWVDCNNGNSPISGANNQTFVATANGSYAVILNENGCAEFSPCTTVTSVGLDEIHSFGLSLYPNPTRGSFKVDFEKNMGEIEISIFSINGKLVQKSTHNNTQSIDLELNQEDGLYIIEIKSPKGTDFEMGEILKLRKI